ncbi:hypothetical protein QUF80_07400 [Desulfococcaceae bacterium HSG8]|nr:hypothetical protein [Desulfococcaceae bacterium HSG8]
MKTQYPEIIKEIIAETAAGKLKKFNVVSFESAVKEFDRSMHFFSAHVHTEQLDEDIFRDERYVIKQELQIVSMVEERARMYWFKRNKEHLKRIDFRMEELKKTSEYRNIRENDYKALSELRDKVIEELNQEIQPQMIELIKDECRYMYGDKWEEHFNDADIFGERTQNEYWRRYEMPLPFRHWDDRNSWQQFYFARDHEGNFYYERGGSGSSDQRFCHCTYGHLFAVLNDEKPVPTYFFRYDSRNRFVFDREEPGLWLNFMDVHSCYIKETFEILKNVKEIVRHW